MENCLSFAVGPVLMDENTLKLGSEQLPYFRTDEFSKIGKENEELIKYVVKTESSSRAVFLTASGTAAMEAAVINVFNHDDKILIVNGGSFGERFKKICEIHDINYEEIKLNCWEQLTENHLKKYSGKGFTGMLINVHETSTGVLYDMDMVGRFCKKENIILVADAISSLLADEYNMDKSNIDVTICSSQKALALPPGISFIVMNNRAVKRVESNTVKSLYFDLKDYLRNGERGQTPFTPAVGILLQLNDKLKKIKEVGVEEYISKSKRLADDFRSKIKELPFDIPSASPSNALTPLRVNGGMKAHDIFEYIKDNYNVFICPNGGNLKDVMFRVGHIGNLTIADNDRLISIFKDMHRKDLI